MLAFRTLHAKDPLLRFDSRAKGETVQAYSNRAHHASRWLKATEVHIRNGNRDHRQVACNEHMRSATSGSSATVSKA
jgi:hypothetical protein